METNELRIDNLVLSQNTLCIITAINRGGTVEVQTVDSPSVDKCFSEEVMIDRVYPVELTPELLLQIGFKDDYLRYFYKNFCLHITYNEDSIISFYYDPDILEKISIKYLHQLQNLYFAITGEELEISL